ncbi:hypothetical protein FK531_05600 [Rhodococcus spelaei]|uniref:Uncharacterized protein n=1 Tax=Rhodococcus spelaei TaxID=2546320 RepID=A0A541BP64_9NOCA|nr:hypothetical protein [Rhodococcus spelaei]TQF74125.1 hypothetical protein FK531_05600 [Rhodococcus spelaei]
MRLVPDPPTPDDDDEFTLTPRQMHIVAIVARTLADSAYDDIDTHGDAPVTAGADRSVFTEYPATTWDQPAAWRRHAARSFDDLAADAESGRSPRPTCTGEEMALHLILRRASALHHDGHFDDELAAIPRHPEDSDWAGPLDYLFEDHDVLTLFDGITPDDGVNLDPPAWFDPFEPPRARDPQRGYRR